MTRSPDFGRAMREIAAVKGDFVLFALFMPVDATRMSAGDPSTWDLVVSAPWLDRGKLKTFGELVDLLKKSIGKRALLQLSGVQTVAGADPTVRFVLKNFPVKDGDRIIENADLPTIHIERGIIYRAWRSRATKKRPARRLQPVTASKSARSRG